VDDFEKRLTTSMNHPNPANKKHHPLIFPHPQIEQRSVDNRNLALIDASAAGLDGLEVILLRSSAVVQQDIEKA
jgi:hypothetical protein